MGDARAAEIDRIACPWLIRRFIDPWAEFLYIPTGDVFGVAEKKKTVAFDISGAEFSHVAAECSFDAFMKRFRLSDPGLLKLAPTVRLGYRRAMKTGSERRMKLAHS